MRVFECEFLHHHRPHVTIAFEGTPWLGYLEGQNFGTMEEAQTSVSTVKNSSSRYTQRTIGVMPVGNGKLNVIGTATDGIGRYLQASVEELQADPNWRDRLILVENREGGLFFKLAESGLLDL